MKKTILSALLACLLIVSMIAFTGCASKDDIAGLGDKVEENANKADAAAQKAADDLAAAKQALETLIKDGDKKDSDAIAKAVDDLNAAIAAAKKAATDADAALKTELEKAITDATDKVAKAAKAELDAAKAELEAAMEKLDDKLAAGDTNAATELANAKKALEDKITGLSEICDGLKATDTATTESLNALKDSLTASLDTVKKAAIQLEDWDATTEDIIANGLDELQAKYDEFYAKMNTYSGDNFDKVDSIFIKANIRLIRATSAKQVDDVIANFVEEAAKVRTIVDEIYDSLVEAEGTLDKIDAFKGQDILTDEAKALIAQAKTQLDNAKAKLDAAVALNNVDINAAIAAYGPDAIDLSARYTQDLGKFEAFVAEYNKQLQIHGGQLIKDRMDEALKNLITPDTDLTGLRADYDTWAALDGNDLTDVEGFADTYARFQKAEARVAQLVTAKAEAEVLNNRIVALQGEIIKTGASKQNQTDLAALQADVKTWVDTYFADEYAAELPTADAAGSANYLLVNHELLNTVAQKYEELVEKFKKAAADFLAAFNAIPDPIDLLSGDEVQNALDAYNTWVLAEKLGNFDYALGDGKTPGDYYDAMIAKKTEFEALCAPALADYNTNVAPILADGYVVTIYKKADVDAAIAWFDKYGVKDAEGAFVFENGYVLSKSVTVTKEVYDAVLAVKADFDTLEAAKNAETQAVIDAITNIGTVSINKKDAIVAARTAYDAWLNGTNAPEGFTADQYKINTADDTYAVTNEADLTAAEAKLTALETELAALHAKIEALVAKKNLNDFASVDERNTYKTELDDIDAAIATFTENNGGDLEGQITDEENAKLANGKLAVAMFDQFAAVIAKIDAVKASVAAKTLTTKDIEMINAVIDAIGEQAKADVVASTEIGALNDIVTIAVAKLDAINETAVIYEDAVAKINADSTIVDKTTAFNKLYFAYENSITNIKKADTVDTVALLKGLVQSELDAIKPGLNPDLPAKDYDIAYSVAGIAVDGNMDAVYTNSLYLKADKVWSGSSADAKGTAQAWFVFDDKGLYVYAEVKDETIYDLNGAGDGDMFQVYVDFVNNHTDESESDYKATGKDRNRKLGWVTFGADGSHAAAWGFAPDMITSAAKKIAGGYAIEGYIPFPENVNNVIGIGLEVHDDTDGDGKRNGIVVDTDFGMSYWNGYKQLVDFDLQICEDFAGSTATYVPSNNAIVVDGVKDKYYGVSNAVKIENQKYINGEVECLGNGYISISDDMLFVYVEIKDATPYSVAGISGGDRVQVYFLMPDGSLGYIHVSRENVAADVHGFSGLLVSSATKEIEGGYAVEFATKLPEASATAIQNAEKGKIGVGFQVEDYNVDGVRKCITYSAAFGNNFWADYKLCNSVFFAKTNRVKYDIAYTASVTLDAKKDAAYDSSLMIESKTPYKGTDFGGTNGQAKAWFLSTSEGMYIYAEVLDDTMFDAKCADKIQVYVDFINNHKESGLTGGDYLTTNRDTPYWNSNRIGYGEVYGEGSQNIYHGFWQAQEDGIAKSAYAKIDGGYAVEIFLPFPEEGPSAIIGLGIQSQDDTDGVDDWNTLYYDNLDGSNYWSDYTLLPDYTIEYIPAPKAVITGDTSRFQIEKNVFVEGEPIYVSAIGEGYDWVGIVHSSGGSSIKYYYLGEDAEKGYGSGDRVDLRFAPRGAGGTYGEFPAGNYTIYFFPNDGSLPDVQPIAYAEIEIVAK